MLEKKCLEHLFIKYCFSFHATSHTPRKPIQVAGKPCEGSQHVKTLDNFEYVIPIACEN